LNVLDFLVSDSQNQNQILIIGCYRSDNVDENSLLHNKILAMQERRSKCKLVIIVEECAKVMAEIEETSLSLHLFTGRMIWQTIQNLLEQFPEDAPELEVFSKRKHKSTKLTASIMHLVEGELLWFHGDYEATAERTIEYGDLYPPNNPCFCSVMTETFYRAVAVHAMALETNGNRYKWCAKKLQKVIFKWAKAGNPNVVYFDLLLKAENATLEKYEDADGLYKDTDGLYKDADGLCKDAIDLVPVRTGGSGNQSPIPLWTDP